MISDLVRNPHWLEKHVTNESGPHGFEKIWHQSAASGEAFAVSSMLRSLAGAASRAMGPAAKANRADRFLIFIKLIKRSRGRCPCFRHPWALPTPSSQPV